jgi:hypothetical protein
MIPLTNNSEKIALRTVIEKLSGHKLLIFRKNRKTNAIIRKITKAARKTVREVNRIGINKNKKRTNEVGNAIESLFKKALTKIGYTAETPQTSSGKKKSAGYPDLLVTTPNGTRIYVECKTFNENTLKSNYRTFYLSPSDQFKVIDDLHHLLVSFIIYEEKNRGKVVFKCKGWKIVKLSGLKVKLKREYNSNNADLYAKENIIAES